MCIGVSLLRLRIVSVTWSFIWNFTSQDAFQQRVSASVTTKKASTLEWTGGSGSIAKTSWSMGVVMWEPFWKFIINFDVSREGSYIGGVSRMVIRFSWRYHMMIVSLVYFVECFFKFVFDVSPGCSAASWEQHNLEEGNRDLTQISRSSYRKSCIEGGCCNLTSKGTSLTWSRVEL